MSTQKKQCEPLANPVVRTLLDRIAIRCGEFPIHRRLLALGFSCSYDRRTRCKGKQPKIYDRVCRYTHPALNLQLEIAYLPLQPWLSPCRIVFVANDATGLLRNEIEAVLPVLPEHRLAMAEVAFDFAWNSGVDCEFVLMCGIFGKSALRLSKKYPDVIWFGSRKSSKFVRCYQFTTCDA